MRGASPFCEDSISCSVAPKVREFRFLLLSLSPFYHYGSAIQDGIDWANFATLTAATLVLLVLVILAFRRRDIYT